MGKEKKTLIYRQLPSKAGCEDKDKEEVETDVFDFIACLARKNNILGQVFNFLNFDEAYIFFYSTCLFRRDGEDTSTAADDDGGDDALAAAQSESTSEGEDTAIDPNDRFLSIMLNDRFLSIMTIDRWFHQAKIFDSMLKAVEHFLETIKSYEESGQYNRIFYGWNNLKELPYFSGGGVGAIIGRKYFKLLESLSPPFVYNAGSFRHFCSENIFMSLGLVLSPLVIFGLMAVKLKDQPGFFVPVALMVFCLSCCAAFAFQKYRGYRKAHKVMVELWSLHRYGLNDDLHHKVSVCVQLIIQTLEEIKKEPKESPGLLLSDDEPDDLIKGAKGATGSSALYPAGPTV